MKDIKNFHNRSIIDSDILSAVVSTKKFISQNPDVIFTKADKDNIIVALDRVDYKKWIYYFLIATLII